MKSSESYQETLRNLAAHKSLMLVPANPEIVATHSLLKHFPPFVGRLFVTAEDTTVHPYDQTAFGNSVNIFRI